MRVKYIADEHSNPPLQESTTGRSSNLVMRTTQRTSSSEMQKQVASKSSKCIPSLPRLVHLLLFITFPTVIIFGSNASYPYTSFITSSNHEFSNSGHENIVLPFSILVQISTVQDQLGALLEELHTENTKSRVVAKFADQVLRIAVSVDKLTDKLKRICADPPNTQNDTDKLDEVSDSEIEEGSMGESLFNSRVLRNYTSPKPNRQQGKKNFLGVESVYPSVGLACVGVASNIERFMNYKPYGICPDDWVVAQKLIIGGCDPLPRRKCFSRSPQHYSKPLPVNSSLWTPPAGANILWTQYKCKNYSCLFSEETAGKRGFFKCADCFNLTRRGWELPRNETESAEFTIDEVLRLKPSEIRIGLDFSPTTGTFAAIMRGRNVTIASATLNLGAPFSEVIALRGLLPLYVSVGSRLPFFDNTLDIIHTNAFLDGWIAFDVLENILFDWDRVLRPNGILWIDRFFCSKEDMKLYLAEFSKIGYRKLLWRVVPKTDKQGGELFFSAVLEKPVRS